MKSTSFMKRRPANCSIFLASIYPALSTQATSAGWRRCDHLVYAAQASKFRKKTAAIDTIIVLTTGRGLYRQRHRERARADRSRGEWRRETPPVFVGNPAREALDAVIGWPRVRMGRQAGGQRRASVPRSDFGRPSRQTISTFWLEKAGRDGQGTGWPAAAPIGGRVRVICVLKAPAG